MTIRALARHFSMIRGGRGAETTPRSSQDRQARFSRFVTSTSTSPAPHPTGNFLRSRSPLFLSASLDQEIRQASGSPGVAGESSSRRAGSALHAGSALMQTLRTGDYFGTSKNGDLKTGSCGIRLGGGVNLDQALTRNVGTCRPDAKGASRAGDPCQALSTDAGHRGRTARSREEGTVMVLDRRGVVFPSWQAANQQWEEPLEQGK